MELYKIEEFKRGNRKVEQVETVERDFSEEIPSEDKCLNLISEKNEKKTIKKKKKKRKKKVVRGIVASVAATVIATAILAAVGYMKNINDSIIRQEEQLQTVKDSMTALSESVNQKIEHMEERIDGVAAQNINVYKYSLTEDGIDGLKIEKRSQNISFLAEPSWSEKEYIVVDENTGEHYTAEEIYGETVLLSYIQDNQEIFFVGQINKNMHWEGDCIINVYINNQLELVMDAKYEDGVLQEYKQVMPYTNQKGVDVWLVAERVHEDEYNSGDTWSYYREDDYKKTFSLDNVEASDILTVRKFKKNIKTSLEGVYHGNTYDGFYNDNTGNAYMVKYTRDGYVRLLYRGCFVDGKFDDSSGNAWYITKEEDTEYMYFKGNFSDGKPDHGSNYEFENPISLEKIQDIVSCYFFDCRLIWDEDDNM